jgi:four helix bundle protein
MAELQPGLGTDPMTYERFEDLPVWRKAIDLAVRMYALTAQVDFSGHAGLRDQIERAAVSIATNIAEGFERGTTNELLAFIYIARGSAGEVRSMLCLLERIPRFGDLKFEISNLKSDAENIACQLRGWANALQNSPIKGQLHLTEQERRAAESARRRDRFMDELRRIREQGGDGTGRAE